MNQKIFFMNQQNNNKKMIKHKNLNLLQKIKHHKFMNQNNN